MSYVQNFLEVALLDINQSNHSLMGAVCVVLSVYEHIPEQSISRWSLPPDYDHQTSTSALIKTTFGTESLFSDCSFSLTLSFYYHPSFVELLLSSLALFLCLFFFHYFTLLFAPPLSIFSFPFSSVAPLLSFSSLWASRLTYDIKTAWQKKKL